MGVAILWIMLFHLGFLPQVFICQFLSSIGYAGVDMFVLLSGYGIYFSLSKTSSLITWYKKRLVRIIPIWLIFSIILYYYCNPECYHFFSFQFWQLTCRTWWFMPFILSAYIVAPLFYRVAIKRRIILSFTIFGILLSMLIYEIVNIKNVILDLSLPRYIVFLIGMKLAHYSSCEDTIKKTYILFSAIVPIIFLFVLYNQELVFNTLGEGVIDKSYMPYRIYPAAFLGFSISLIIAKLFSLTRYINVGFRWLGNNSLELYLTHVLLWWYFMNNNLSYFIVIIPESIIIAFIIGYLNRKLSFMFCKILKIK